MIILEGTDAVGKTSVIKNLVDYELSDRNNTISKLFEFNISLIDRAEKLKEYIDSTNNYVIILINNDKDELERRVNSRKVIDKFDEYTYLYNLIYLETYLYMEKNDMLNHKLFMIDCTGLSILEEINKVKSLINYIIKLQMKGE